MSDKDVMSDNTAMLLWAEANGWERFSSNGETGHRKQILNVYVWAKDEDIGQMMVDYQPEFLATYFRAIEVRLRSWMN